MNTGRRITLTKNLPKTAVRNVTTRIASAQKKMFVMAVATSIDALAVGITFAFLQVNIFAAVAMIGVTTFALSFVGVKIGNVFGAKYEKKAELSGGVILILIGLKILLEHLGVISF